MSDKVKTCLWFDDDGEDAAKLYVSLVPGSRVDKVYRAPIDYPGGKEGDVLLIEFTLGGQTYQALNGRNRIAYGNAASIVVLCEDQAEIDRLWAALTEGGKTRACGWLEDRFGVPWQIVPRRHMELMADPDPGVRERVMQAMMTMVKFDLAAIERAAEG